jgi:20S proteasome alpha/beta subunit
MVTKPYLGATAECLLYQLISNEKGVKMMFETITILKSILEEYERKVEAIKTAIRAVESSGEEQETEPETEFNVVRKNEPFDFSQIQDFNQHGGGIRADI